MNHEEILDALVTRCFFLKMRIKDLINKEGRVPARLFKEFQNSTKTLNAFLTFEWIDQINPFLFRDCLTLTDCLDKDWESFHE